MNFQHNNEKPLPSPLSILPRKPLFLLDKGERKGQYEISRLINNTQLSKEKKKCKKKETISTEGKSIN